jgi:glucosamine--fructose-6-phosphate aminotransferase (isomerizing)
MCGIYGLLSAREVLAAPGDELFGNLDGLLHCGRVETLGSLLSDEGAAAELTVALSDLSGAASRWTARSSCLAVLEDESLRARLETVVARLTSWTVALEEFVASGHASVQHRRELVNELIVGAKDVAWRIERDVLENALQVSQLIEDVEPFVRARAWELNMVLSSLDRLEVRGRDSAGIAMFVRFPEAEDLESFLEGPTSDGRWRREFESRQDARLVDGSVVRPSSAANVLLFVFKVASEVGEMGDNVATLRRRIAADELFQAVIRESAAEPQFLAHTRWASNGVISQANCHPVDSTVLRDGAVHGAAAGRLVAVLNGDIDNYRELVEKYVTGSGAEIDPAITTDAKIIPVVVAHFLENPSVENRSLEKCGGLEQAFCDAFAEFEGSMAIGLMAADRPGEFLFGQKGSGQGLFFGVGGESVAVASEMYGVVELTSNYVKAEGEREERGEVFRLRANDRDVAVDLLEASDFVPVNERRARAAEITTRDINRAGFPHFFLKEISESVESVAKTVRGKFEVTDSGEVRSLLGAESIPLALVNGLREGRVRHVAVLGQGTAAVAAQGVAHLLARALRSLPSAVTVSAEKATEFSAQSLRDDMSDTLVVAVSQSGTTTDTNRTVDLARQRGAWVLGIVNRRNSDLVYKSHAVLYTSDGRDIEMSVASTKAFYAQNVAGQVLALSLAKALGTFSNEELKLAVEELEALPDILRRTLDLQGQIAGLAREYSLRRRHWAVVGSGASKIAADEIRIKLSELCYKSIAVDFLEDKKHIDLSSEPLVIVCAVGMAPEVVSDAVKEVAIFKAHNAVPIVITDDEQDGFEPYAAGLIRVPKCDGALGYLPATMVGHLFGYHAAETLDSIADKVRRLRARAVALQEASGHGDEDVGAFLAELSRSTAQTLVELEEAIESGALNGGLDVHHAVRLSRVVQLCLGRVSMDGFGRWRQSSSGLVETVVATLSDAVAELSRPIDAIKHQAKTVTVGISRGESTASEGVLSTAISDLGISREGLLESHRGFLTAFESLVARVDGGTAYRVTGLDPLGRPMENSRIVVERKIGCARTMESRNETEQQLCGNKWTVVKIRDIFLGYGGSDGRRILIVPFVGEEEEGRLVVLHIELVEAGNREHRLKALAARGEFFDRLKGTVTELSREWDPSMIDAVDNATLFFGSPESVAEELAETQV